MIDLKKVLAVVPARKNSSFRSKNIQPILGKPMIQYTLDAVKKSGINCVITSDDPNVLNYASYYGFAQDERPRHLANDTATLDQVITHIAEEYISQFYILLPPTSPLRSAEDIISSLSVYFSSRNDDGTEHRDFKFDSLISVTSESRSIWKQSGANYFSPLVEITENRQQVRPVYIANGSIFISSSQAILKSGKKVSGRVGIYCMEPSHSVDVHDQDDIKLCEYYLNNLSNETSK